MIVVFDTNVWRNEFALRSPAGSAVRFFLTQNEARLALPEVVRLEVEQLLRETMHELVGIIEDKHRQLLTLFGNLKEIVLPSDEEIEKKVAEIMASVGVELMHIPFSFESAQSAFIKTINKEPPNAPKKQSFKDGVLWADCLALLAEDDVILITSDTDFYQDRKPSLGLAANLHKEASHMPHRLTLLPALTELLSQLRRDVDIDEELLAVSFPESVSESVQPLLSRNSFALGTRRALDRSLFATENPHCLFLKFTMEYDCADITSDDRTGTLTLEGNGRYNFEMETFEDLHLDGAQLRFISGDGTEEQRRAIVLAAANIVLGHKDVIYSVQQSLD